MRITAFLRVSTVFLFLISAAVAKDGRDFAGFYSLSAISAKGDDVLVTLSLKLSNYRGEDLNQVVIEIRSHPQAGLLGNSAPVEEWRNGKEIAVTRQFTLQRNEYERWRAGDQPEVSIVYRDHDGQTWTRPSQLNNRPDVGF